MSEQILERSAPASDSSPEAPRRGSHTFLLVAMAIIGGLVIGGALLFLLQPGGSDDLGAAAPGAAGTGGTGATGGSSEEAAPATAQKPAKAASAARITSRDPFAPLVPKAPPPPPAPVIAPAGQDPAAPAGTSDPVGATPATGGTISALNVSPLGDSVTLKLDGKKYSVDEGESFAKSYRLYDIFNADCAGFLYGDQNAVVCRGDSVTLG